MGVDQPRFSSHRYPFSMAYGADRRDRWKGGALAILVTGVFGWALLTGLIVQRGGLREEALETFSVLPDTPPKPRAKPIPPPKRVSRPEGEAAPPNLRAQPTEIVVPPLPPLPTPVIAAPVAGTGSDASAGAAEVPGPGTGAGGIGDGFGAGGSGDGDGGGWRDETPPEGIRDQLDADKLPDALKDETIRATLSVRYLVQLDGRVTDCDVVRSTGRRALDAAICSLIERDFRYRPARDARNRPFVSTIIQNHQINFD